MKITLMKHSSTQSSQHNTFITKNMQLTITTTQTHHKIPPKAKDQKVEIRWVTPNKNTPTYNILLRFRPLQFFLHAITSCIHCLQSPYFITQHQVITFHKYFSHPLLIQHHAMELLLREVELPISYIKYTFASWKTRTNIAIQFNLICEKNVLEVYLDIQVTDFCVWWILGFTGLATVLRIWQLVVLAIPLTPACSNTSWLRATVSQLLI